MSTKLEGVELGDEDRYKRLTWVAAEALQAQSAGITIVKRAKAITLGAIGDVPPEQELADSLCLSDLLDPVKGVVLVGDSEQDECFKERHPWSSAVRFHASPFPYLLLILSMPLATL